MKLKKKTTEETIKVKGLFDHVKHIRQTQDPDYYDSLSESDRKTFSKYMILRVLSMDKTIIEEISYVSKYFEVLPEKQFYKLLINTLPKSYGFNPYIKSSKKAVNETILNCLCTYFNVGTKDATDYYNIFISHEEGLIKLIELIKSHGYSEKETEKLFE
jgi:hypothetical protein